MTANPHRHHLPQLDGGLFLTDGGIETSLIFHDGLPLPLFAAFDLLRHDEGIRALHRYYLPYLELARAHGAGFILESPTWRASPRWAGQLGYAPEALDAANRRAIALMEQLRDEHATEVGPVVISGCVGPRDDGYAPAEILTAGAARDYHRTQIDTFARTAADMVTAITMTHVEEAVGIVRAAQDAGLPVVISFTVETDGRLPSGRPLGEAIEQVDAETGRGPAYYMVNCAHPTHLEDALAPGGAWRERVRGLRANASTRSHAELDEAADLDDGDPADLGARYAALRTRLPRLSVLGGCCGTDHRHVGEAARAYAAATRAPRTQHGAEPARRRVGLSTGVTLPYVEQGDPDGLPVVFLHGYSDSWRSWELLLEHVPATWRVLVPTQRGHGDAGRPAGGYRPEDHVADLAAFLDALDVPAAVVVGHSGGSYTAQGFAVDHPDRTLALGLVGAFRGFGDNPDVQGLWEVVRELTDPVDPAFVRGFQESCVSGPLPAGYLDAIVAESLKLPARVWRDYLRGLIDSTPPTERGTIGVPTVVLWGDADAFCPAGDQDALVDAIPASRLVTFPGVNHCPQWEAPARVAEELRALVAEVRPGVLALS